VRRVQCLAVSTRLHPADSTIAVAKIVCSIIVALIVLKSRLLINHNYNIILMVSTEVDRIVVSCALCNAAHAPSQGLGGGAFLTIGSKKEKSFFACLFAISWRERGAGRNLNAFPVELRAVMLSTERYDVPLVGAGFFLDMCPY